MRYCVCGQAIPRRSERGHREREYCSDRCRQRAWRARHKDRHKRERIIQAAFERGWNAIEQDVHREGWQDERQTLRAEIKRLEIHRDINEFGDDLLKFKADLCQAENAVLKSQLADKEAEIVRLTTLLEAQSKRPRRT